HLLGLGDAAQGDAGGREGVGFFRGHAHVPGEGLAEAGPAVGVDGAGVDGVDADPAAPVLVGQGQGQVDVGRVGGGGGDLPIGGLDAVVADHVDDGAAALLQHVGQRGVAGPHVTHELQLEGLVPVAGLQVEDAAARCAAGV